MPKTNTAYSILWPTDSRVVIRACFLYVGQGSSILLLIRSGTTYKLLLADCNLDKERGGINVPGLLNDVSRDGHLQVFLNTHPHDDHLRGIKEVADALIVDEVWHSGHKPGKEGGNHYSDLQTLIKDVERRKGSIVELLGSRDEKQIYDSNYYVLAPAKHVNEEIDGEDPCVRAKRIHENGSVLRFGKDSSWVLITGDADLVAFRDNITSYHRERLKSFLLDASHHGSRSFFKDKEEDEPNLDALRAIAPEYVAISAPAQKDSPHGHPHEDAVKLYSDQVGKKNVLHSGNGNVTYFFDIFEDGTHSGPMSDNGELAKKYSLDKKSGGDEKTVEAAGVFIRPKESPEFTPRKYA